MSTNCTTAFLRASLSFLTQGQKIEEALKPRLAEAHLTRLTFTHIGTLLKIASNAKNGFLNEGHLLHENKQR